MNEKARFDYQSYLNTEEWKRKAHKCKENAGFRCSTCGTCDSAENPLNAHHRAYPRINGSEPDNDLVCLCNDCHKWFHHRLKIVSGRLIPYFTINNGRIIPKQYRIAAANEKQFSLDL